MQGEGLLYRLFGVNAELLIDHAWGWEPCTIKDIKAYRPESTSTSQGQVLQSPYNFDKALVVVKEMADALALDLVERRLVTNQIVLTVGYDVESLTDPNIRYDGPVSIDRYGRRVPKQAHGTANLQRPTSSSRILTTAVEQLYHRIVNSRLLVRRINLTACRLADENTVLKVAKEPLQLSLFDDTEALLRQRQAEETALAKERKLQEATIAIKRQFGKNALLRGLDFSEGATARERNGQIGGHKA